MAPADHRLDVRDDLHSRAAEHQYLSVNVGRGERERREHIARAHELNCGVIHEAELHVQGAGRL
jgi:hypothetical protein